MKLRWKWNEDLSNREQRREILYIQETYGFRFNENVFWKEQRKKLFSEILILKEAFFRNGMRWCGMRERDEWKRRKMNLFPWMKSIFLLQQSCSRPEQTFVFNNNNHNHRKIYTTFVLKHENVLSVKKKFFW